MPGNEIKEIEGQTHAGLRSRQEIMKHFELKNTKSSSFGTGISARFSMDGEDPSFRLVRPVRNNRKTI